MKNNLFADYRIVISNFSHLAFGEFSSKAFGFLTTIFLARVLGAEQFGEYSWVMALYAYAYLMANFGFETHGTRTIAREVSNDFMSGIFVLRLLYGSVVLLLILLLNYFLLPKFNALLMLQSASLLLLPFNAQYIFRGLNKAKYDGLSRTIQAGLFFLLVSAFVKTDGILLLPLFWFVTSALTVISFYLLMKKIVQYTFAFPSASSIKTILKDSLPVGIASALILFFLNFGTILLGLYADKASVGLYSAAYKIYYFGYSSLALYYIAFLPSLSRRSNEEFPRIRRDYMRALFFLAVVLVLVGMLLSKPLILLLFGEHYSAAIPVMKILFLSLAAASINFAIMTPLQAIGEDKLFLQLLLLRVVFFIIVCFILIPKWGMTGAAYALLIAETISTLFSVGIFRKRMKRIP